MLIRTISIRFLKDWKEVIRMSYYIDFCLSYNSYLRLVDGLEELCEKSDNFVDIENYYNLIQVLEEQKDKYFSEYSKELREELGLDRNSNDD